MRVAAAAVVVGVGIVLAGCAHSAGPSAGPGGDATFMHPTTGDLRHCTNWTASSSLVGGVIGGVLAGNAYADCKTALEELGYVRQVLPPARPAAARVDADRVFCRERVSHMTRERGEAEYWRCRAGY